MSGASPRLSVVVPCFEHGRDVGDSLRCLLGQSVTDLEVVVVDDASRDDSARVIADVARNDARVRTLRNAENLGAAAAIARGLAVARAPYLFVQAADHRVEPDLLARSVALLDAHSAAGVCVSDFAFVDSRHARVYPKRMLLARHAGYVSPGALCAKLASGDASLAGYGAVFRAQALRAAGGYRAELRWHSDWWLTLLVALRHGACVLPEPLIRVRLDRGSYSAGARVWREQRPVLAALLALIEAPEQADVRARLIACGALAYFGIDLLRVGLESRHSGAGPSPALGELPVRGAIAVSLRRAAIGALPRRLREVFWRARHTHQLLREPRAASAAEVSA